MKVSCLVARHWTSNKEPDLALFPFRNQEGHSLFTMQISLLLSLALSPHLCIASFWLSLFTSKKGRMSLGLSPTHNPPRFFSHPNFNDRVQASESLCRDSPALAPSPAITHVPQHVPCLSLLSVWLRQSKQ